MDDLVRIVEYICEKFGITEEVQAILQQEWQTLFLERIPRSFTNESFSMWDKVRCELPRLETKSFIMW